MKAYYLKNRTITMLRIWTAIVGITLVSIGATECYAQYERDQDDEIAILQILQDFEDRSAILEVETRMKVRVVHSEAMRELQKIQDSHVREGMLDQAQAVQEVVQLLRSQSFGKVEFTNHRPGMPVPPNRNQQPRVDSASPQDRLPEAASQIKKRCDREVEDIEKSAKAKLKEAATQASVPLRKIQQAMHADARLEGAMKAREAIQLIVNGYSKALPDPGYMNASQEQNGKVFFYELTAREGGTVYGTDVYCGGSHLGSTAIHAGVLRANQKGVVKVTVLPGANGFVASLRNGIQSQSYSSYPVAFKIEAVRELE